MDCFYRFCLNYNLLINTRQANRPASYLFYLQELLLTFHHIRRILIGCFPNPIKDAGDNYHQQSHKDQ